MSERACTEFLRWALPLLGRRWAGYRKVQGLVCKRLGRRLREDERRQQDRQTRPDTIATSRSGAAAGVPA